MQLQCKMSFCRNRWVGLNVLDGLNAVQEEGNDRALGYNAVFVPAKRLQCVFKRADFLLYTLLCHFSVIVINWIYVGQSDILEEISVLVC